MKVISFGGIGFMWGGHYAKPLDFPICAGKTHGNLSNKPGGNDLLPARTEGKRACPNP
jgi:hypothetical protein